MEITPASPSEYAIARGIVDAAMLELAADAYRRGSVLLAREEDRALGVLVLDGSEIAAIAVRPKRRGQGIGSALVREAARRRGELVVAFDPHVRPFYESLRFIVHCEDGRYRGRRGRRDRTSRT